MISNIGNLLFERKLSLTWIIVIAIILSLFKISICNGQGEINSPSLLFNDPPNDEVSDIEFMWHRLSIDGF